MRLAERIVNSAVWAAYGDALGFVSELANAADLKRRLGGGPMKKTVPWKHRVGGRFGATVELPAGAYSDDTQLRLATSRCIRTGPVFDVEVFAKIELPVWRCYALGAGRGTRAAASNLTGPHANWTNNFFDNKDGSYLMGGGNGAPMRIQPHVWSTKNGKTPEALLLDVVRNTICTHGHARGIIGAAFHALALRHAIREGEVSGPLVWRDHLNELEKLSQVVRNDDSLRTFWIPTWERLAKSSIENALKVAIGECYEDIKEAKSSRGSDPQSFYQGLVSHLGCLDPKTRGSATKTAIVASAAAWLFSASADEALLTIANVLGSDTDSIATMAGALLGATTSSTPPGEIADKDYIRDEARRLADIAEGAPTASHAYPDLLKWKPPHTQLDTIGYHEGKLLVAGLGYGKPIGREYMEGGRGGALWQWLQVPFGQTILAKRRTKPGELSDTAKPLRSANVRGSVRDMRMNQPELFRGSHRAGTPAAQAKEKSLDTLSKEVIDSNFNPERIGQVILELSGREYGIEQAIAFASIIAKAKRVRGATKGQA